MLPKESYRFMADLYRHNSKAWFDANRARYERYVRQPMKALAEDLEDPVSLLLPEFSGKARLSRINNDIRFSPRKLPYKEHVWISFGSSSGPRADLFAAIDRQGWTTGAGLYDPSREVMDNWRRNLLKYVPIWRRYAAAVDIGKQAVIYSERPYKKPLSPDIPEDLVALIQPRSVWIVDAYRMEFRRSPFEDFLRGLCKFLPVYLFMSTPTKELTTRLAELGRIIIAPNKDIGELWRTLRS
jgi:uncharacterized protein (TIGR02453 family)